MIIAEEQYGSRTDNSKVFISCQNLIVPRQPKSHEWQPAWNIVKNVFLPKGFPESVSQDYLLYQMWDSIQAFCSSITGSLSTQAILKGAGVGDASATAVGATITWIIKDGCGHVGRIVFAWYKGTELDCNSKKWRLFADILNDAALFLELLSPVFPNYFTSIVCISSVMKSIVGVAGGATRAALTQHQARRNNLGDVSAKDGSQETLVNLSALICSLILLPVLSGKFVLTWTLFFIFTLLHIVANYLAVTSLCMETLNVERYMLLVEHYLNSNSEVLSVRAANQKENVWMSLWPKHTIIKLGSSFGKTVTTVQEYTFLKEMYRGSDYMLNLDITSEHRAKVNIVLRSNSTVRTQLTAMFQAILLKNALDQNTILHLRNGKIKQLLEADCKDVPKLLCLSKYITDSTCEDFLTTISEQGWKTEFTLLGADEWRAKWTVL